MSSNVDRLRGAVALTPEVKRLGIVLGLPLLDGVFVTLVVVGVLDSLVGILLVGALVFAGSGSIAVILSDLTDDPLAHYRGLVVIGLLVIAIASVQAAVAPSIATLLDETTVTRFAALLLVLLGMRIGSRSLNRRLPGIGVIVLLGLALSLRPNGVALEQSVDVQMALAGGVSASIGLLVALVVLFLGSRLVVVMDRERFRFGGGIALVVLGFTLVTPIPTYVPLLVLGLSLLLAFDRDTQQRMVSVTDPAGTDLR